MCFFVKADQTPTPTRVIRNCGEVGFDLIEDFNVFEETFRREVSSKKNSVDNSTLDTPDIQNEDTLHTPNVLGYFRLTSNEKLTENFKKEENVPNKKEKLIQEIDGKNTESTASQGINVENGTTATVPMIILPAYVVPLTKIDNNPITTDNMPGSNLNHLKCIRPKVLPKNQTITCNPMKKKLKEILLKTQSEPEPIATVESTSSLQQLKQKITIGRKPIERRSIKSNKMKTSDSNRAAAKRYRNKMKEKHDLLIKDNAKLLAENKTLRSEVESLKRSLLAHQNCSLSKKVLVINGMSAQAANVQPIYVIQGSSASVRKDHKKPS